jgi:hypothetical protein
MPAPPLTTTLTTPCFVWMGTSMVDVSTDHVPTTHTSPIAGPGEGIGDGVGVVIGVAVGEAPATGEPLVAPHAAMIGSVMHAAANMATGNERVDTGVDRSRSRRTVTRRR